MHTHKHTHRHTHEAETNRATKQLSEGGLALSGQLWDWAPFHDSWGMHIVIHKMLSNELLPYHTMHNYPMEATGHYANSLPGHKT